LRKPEIRGKVGRVSFKGGIVGLAMLAMLIAVPAASASSASLRGGMSGTVVYRGDAAADSVTLRRYVESGGSHHEYYIVTDNGGITAGTDCVKTSDTTAACQVDPGLKRYDIATGSGDDTVGFNPGSSMRGDTAGGTADLGPGADRFTGLTTGTSADAVKGGDGADTIDGGAGNDGVDGGADADLVSGGPGNDLLGGGDGADHVNGNDGADLLAGGAGNDQVAGEAGNDAVDGGPGDDELEFGAADVAPGVGAGGDDLHGGDGVDRLSYNDHPAAITLTLDGQPGDGSAGEGDNVHDDIETVIGTTQNDVLTGDDLGQDLYGHAGQDTIDGGGGDDLLNGGSGEDVIRGGAGDDALEGSADGDRLDGGPGRDLFEGDNECTVQPCTGGSDEIQARDGEQDTVNCGVGADTAVVDAIDVVALDTQQGCENVDRAGAPGAPGGTAAALPTMRVRGSRVIQTLLKRGLRVDVTCPAACRIRARLILRKTVVASTRRTRIAGAVTRLRLKANRPGKRRLKRRTKVLMTLVVDVTDSAGHKTTLAHPLTLKKAKAAKKKKG
jgi:Ca2+-binding RTX toxin-like protein